MQNKTVWYGAKDNQVQFADNETTLAAQGINNPKSFTVNGEIDGLNIVGGAQQEQSNSTAQTL